MRKKILTLFTALGLVMVVNAQDALKEIETLEQAKLFIDKNIKQIEDMNLHPKLDVREPKAKEEELPNATIMISMSPISSTSKPYVDLSNSQLKELLQKYFSKMEFSQSYNYPESCLRFTQLCYFVFADVTNRGSMFFSNLDPDVQLTKIYYSDGTTQIQSDIISDCILDLDNAKSIDSVEVKINLRYPAYYHQIKLSEATPVYDNDGYKAQLIRIGDNCAEAIVSAKLKSDSIVPPMQIGANRTGKEFSPEFSHYTQYPSEEMGFKLQKILNEAKIIQSNLSANKYADVDAFKEDQQKRIDVLLPDQMNFSDYKLTYYFDDNVDTLKIYYAAGFDSIQQTAVIRNERFRQYNSDTGDYTRLYDRNTGKYGVINKSGALVIPFQYDDLTYLRGKLFRGGRVSKSQVACYLLDEKNERFVKKDFVFSTTYHSLYKDTQYTRIENYVDEDDKGSAQKPLVGLADFEGNIVIPIQYSGIYRVYDEKGLATLKKDNNKLGLYKLGVGEVLPFDYEGISVVDDYIYTWRDSLINNENTITQLFDVYDLNLKQINKPGWNLWPSTYFDSSSDALIPVRHKTSRDVFYINKQGKVVIPPSDVYDYGSRFSYGLARVRKDGKYGYMNTKGKIVIPCVYNDGEDYTGRSIFVRQGQDYMIIDAKNNVLRTFKLGLASTQRSKYGEPIRTEYILKNGRIYDDDGNLVTEDEK